MLRFLPPLLAFGVVFALFYALFTTSYVSLTNSQPWANIWSLYLSLAWLAAYGLVFYFFSFRPGLYKQRLRAVGRGSILKGLLVGVPGILIASMLLGLLSVEGFAWAASYTNYVDEIADEYEVVYKGTGSRRGITLRVADEHGRTMLLRFGAGSGGGRGLQEGDRVRVRCKGFASYCRILEWHET